MPNTLPHRLRAAREYAGLSQEALAEQLGVHVRTVKRSEGGARKVKRQERVAIAEICDVPIWFLEDGWEGWRSQRQAEPVDAEGHEALRHLEDRPSKREAG